MNDKSTIDYQGGESIDLKSIILSMSHNSFKDRLNYFGELFRDLTLNNNNFFQRTILSPAGPEMLIKSIYDSAPKKMLMFGSNNYLDFANHPKVIERIKKELNQYGSGVGGPPLLNGSTKLHNELEEHLSEIKRSESTMIFSSGYSANVGLVSGLAISENDCILYDKYSHASFRDGMKLSKAHRKSFKHNCLEDLNKQLQKEEIKHTNKIVAVEGVYSMDGDTAPLDKILDIAKAHGAMTILDDAHSTLLLGKNGHGTAEHYGVEGQIDVTMGTFSKAFAVNGGFISGSKELINYLKFLARSYMFSSSMPIPTIAAALACLEISEKEPEHRQRLFENIDYAKKKLRPYGLVTEPEAAIITLRVPIHLDIRNASFDFHKMGIFINSIEYPAVPLNEQRFRISMMATHTKEQIDRLVDVVDYVWNKPANSVS